MARAKIDNRILYQSSHNSVLSYNASWNSENHTEKLAHTKALKFLPYLSNTCYLGFPWSTIIDLINTKKSEYFGFIDIFLRSRSLLKNYEHIITVCHHFDFINHIDMFSKAGVTHVFTPQFSAAQHFFSKYPNLKLYPFPHAPFQLSDNCDKIAGKKYLFSYIVPEKNQNLRPCGFLDLFSCDHPGTILACNFNDFDQTTGDGGQKLTTVKPQNHIQSTQNDLPRFLAHSVFFLCSSQSSVNSQLLWDSIGCNTIPVIIGDTLNLPGNKSLWEDATVTCSDRRQDIFELPGYLAALSKDEARLQRKRNALRQLWMLYGPDFFIYDIHKLFLFIALENAKAQDIKFNYSYSRLFSMASIINSSNIYEKNVFDTFILGCSNFMLLDPSGFKLNFNSNSEFRSAYRKSLNSCHQKYLNAMNRNLNHTGLNLN